MDVNLRSLIGKFNPTTRNATEAAAGLCLARTHYNVEIEHYLFKLLDTTDGDFALIARHAEIDKGRFATELTRALDRFKTGNGRTPTLSPDFVETMTQAWTPASRLTSRMAIAPPALKMSSATSGTLPRTFRIRRRKRFSAPQSPAPSKPSYSRRRK